MFPVYSPQARNITLATDGGPVELFATATASGGLVPQPAQLQGTLIIDPQNTFKVASDSNPQVATVQGFTGLAFQTWQGLYNAWGSLSPFLTTPTQIVQVSSHTDNTDPVVLRHILGRAGTLSILGGAPTVLGNPNLSGVVAKNRAAGTNAPLQANLGASGAQGVLVENLSKSSRAWANNAQGANVFRMTQPLVKSAPGGSLAPSEVDTWANNDSVNLLQPIAVNVAELTPSALDGFPRTTLFQLNVFDPAGVAGSVCNLDGSKAEIVCQEVGFQRTLQALGGFEGVFCTNCQWLGNLFASSAVLGAIGGGTVPTSVVTLLSGENQIQLDGDFILSGQGSALNSGPSLLVLGLVFLDVNLVSQVGIVTLATLSYGSHVLYGSAGKNVNMQGQTRLVNSSGTFVAALTAPGPVAGVQLNGVTNATSHTNANNPDVLNSNIPTTPANLDAAQGIAGFGGLAWHFGGASIANVL